TIRDTREGPVVLPRDPDAGLTVISTSTAAPDFTRAADRYAFSVSLIAHNSRADLERCLRSLARHAEGRAIEVVLLDNGSTDDTLPYLRDLARHGLPADYGARLPLRILFADHNLGFAAGRNATLRASQGRILLWLDTSIELTGDIWAPLEAALADPTVGVAGPYRLVTDDLRAFRECAGPDVDAVEGYLMA